MGMAPFPMVTVSFTAPATLLRVLVALFPLSTAPSMVFMARCTAFTAPFTAPLRAFMAQFTVLTALSTAPLMDVTALSACMEFSAPMTGLTAATTAIPNAVAVTAASAVSMAPHWMPTASCTVISGASLNFHWRWRTLTVLGG